jgi:uncharacterized protein (DUF2062 family)
MILKRRHPRTRGQHVKEALWPSMGIMRVVRYYKHRIARMPGTPYFVASGFATGVAVSFTPFVGFHTIIALIIAWLLRGSLIAVFLGIVVAGSPWVLPFIWVSTYKLGLLMLGNAETRAATKALNHQFTFSDALHRPMELLLPMSLGSIPLAIMAWVISYNIVSDIVKRHKDARMKRIHKRHNPPPAEKP